MDGTDFMLYAICWAKEIISVAFPPMPSFLVAEDILNHGLKYIARRRKDAEGELTEDWSDYAEADVEREMIMNGWRPSEKVNGSVKWTVWEKQ